MSDGETTGECSVSWTSVPSLILALKSQSLVDNNMTGGLQVLAPGTEDWQFVKVHQVFPFSSGLEESLDGTLTLYHP